MKKATFLKFIFVFSFLFFGLFFMIYQDKEFRKYSDGLLKNNVEFEGSIISIERSNNHAFGIIGVDVSKSSIKKFNDSTKSEIYPYKIANNYAEVYTTVNTDRKIGESIKVVSNENTVYYLSTKDSEIGDLHLISEQLDKKFVKNHSKIKP